MHGFFQYLILFSWKGSSVRARVTALFGFGFQSLAVEHAAGHLSWRCISLSLSLTHIAITGTTMRPAVAMQSPAREGNPHIDLPPPHLMMLLHSPPPPFKCYVCLHGTRLHVHVCQRHWLRTNMQPRHALFKAPLRPPHTHTHTYVHTRTDRLRCYSPRALAGGAGHAIFSEALPWPLH